MNESTCSAILANRRVCDQRQGHGGRHRWVEIVGLSDPTAPYEAVLAAWEQGDDVTRMWLAREFRQALDGAA